MVAARFPPFTGGVEIHTDEVSRRLIDLGVRVTVVTTDPTGTLPPREVLDGRVIHRVRAWPSRGDLYLAPGITRWIQKRPGGVVHVQGYHTLVAPLAMSASAVRSIPFVVTLHSGGHSSRVRNAIRPAQTKALGPLLARARRLVAVSTFEADLFRSRLSLPPDRFVVIPNGSELPAHDVVLGEGSREDVIVSVGRLERYKGHHRLIAALPLIAAEIPNIRLRIVGNGPYETALRAAAVDAGVGDRVEIRAIGSRDRTELRALLRRAAVGALLSDYESQGISVMEALSAGLPVVTTDASALAELGARGLVVTVPLTASSAEISEAIVRTMRAPRALAKPVLPSWDDAAVALRSIYSEALAAARG